MSLVRTCSRAEMLARARIKTLARNEGCSYLSFLVQLFGKELDKY